MATLTVRHLDDELKAELRVRAAEHGRSMEAEVRDILRRALARPLPDEGMATRIRRGFAGDLSIEPPPRTEQARAAELEDRPSSTQTSCPS
ncbi:FitA-like ribbon-helix-helix domain-containing protein [Saccharomonospora halophila]|uniref:FitA-like ribbon-helix-helix domain-containing protein n=1 Tax=Saccharomonospora halophila TaxID=129922 RepID=UPI00036DDF00|nr:Arc family DNA-binding protein [Saccharomonospora halophila]